MANPPNRSAPISACQPPTASIHAIRTVMTQLIPAATLKKFTVSRLLESMTARQ
jgi:hypothetical protein